MESKRAAGQRESIGWNWSPWPQQKGVGTSCEMLPCEMLLRMSRPLRSACPGKRIPLTRFSGESRISPSPLTPAAPHGFHCFLPKDCFGANLSELWQLEWLHPLCYLEVMALSPSADKALSCCFLPLSSESLLRQ